MSDVAIKNPAGAVEDASKMTDLADATHNRLQDMFTNVDRRLAGVDGDTKNAFMEALKSYYTQARALEARKRNLGNTAVEILEKNIGDDKTFAKRIAGLRR